MPSPGEGTMSAALGQEAPGTGGGPWTVPTQSQGPGSPISPLGWPGSFICAQEANYEGATVRPIFEWGKWGPYGQKATVWTWTWCWASHVQGLVVEGRQEWLFSVSMPCQGRKMEWGSPRHSSVTTPPILEPSEPCLNPSYLRLPSHSLEEECGAENDPGLEARQIWAGTSSFSFFNPHPRICLMMLMILERGEWGEGNGEREMKRERETSISGSTGNLGMSPDQNPTRNPFCYTGRGSNQLSNTCQQRLDLILNKALPPWEPVSPSLTWTKGGLVVRIVGRCVSCRENFTKRWDQSMML